MNRKQRVLLIRSSYLSHRMGIYVVPPLGILTLAAMLRRSRPKEVEFRLLDTGLEKMGASGVAGIIREYEPDVVGISSLSLETRNLHNIAAAARQINPDIRVVAGGPHATCFYDQVLQDPNVDYVVVGEGEETFIELLDVLRDGSPAGDLPGVASVRDGQVHYPGDRPFQEDLDSLPIPAWDLIDLRGYSRKTSMNTFVARLPYAALFTSRACPYRCIYCHGIFGKRFRAQSPERVLEEIELLAGRFGVRELQVFDDVFNFDSKRAMAIAEGVVQRGIDMKFSFPNGVRGDLMTRELVDALARAGTYSITYAVETASPRLQRLIHKNLDLDKMSKVVEWTYDAGIIPCGFYMFGFPTETREEIEQTIDFARRSKMLRALFFAVIPFPRTELYRLAQETYPDYDFNYGFSPDMYYGSHRPYYTEVTGIDIEEYRKKAWKQLYLTPWRIWNILRRFPWNSYFLWTFYQGLAYGMLNIGKREEPVQIASPVTHNYEA